MLAMIIASFALAASGAAQAPAAGTPDAGDKRICRKLEVTGSIMSTRICQTRAQWMAFDADRQKAMDGRRNSNVIDRAQSGNGAAGTDSFGQPRQ